MSSTSPEGSRTLFQVSREFSWAHPVWLYGNHLDSSSSRPRLELVQLLLASMEWMSLVKSHLTFLTLSFFICKMGMASRTRGRDQVGWRMGKRLENRKCGRNETHHLPRPPPHPREKGKRELGTLRVGLSRCVLSTPCGPGSTLAALMLCPGCTGAAL